MKLLHISAILAAALASLATMGPAPPRGPTTPLQAPPPTAPAIGKAVTLEPITLKTKGKTPAEAYKMLGEKTGIDFTPRFSPTAGRGSTGKSAFQNTWETQTFDFDLDNLTFWQAAGKLGESLSARCDGDRHAMQI